MTTVKDIYDYIDSYAPFVTQEEWDNAGLITGSLNAAVERCVMCLDVTADAVRAAVDGDAQLILSHHPLIFSPVKRLEAGTALYSCAQNGISVISAHTNFDRAANGINRNLCKLLDLRESAPVENTFIWTGSLETPMSAEDFAKFDLILAMDENNLEDICYRRPNGDKRYEKAKVKRILEYAPEYGQNVPDPYYHNGFDRVFEMLEAACQNLLTTLSNSQNKEQK